MFPTTISIISLVISITLIIRVFLLDKDYCEFSIINVNMCGCWVSPNAIKGGYNETRFKLEIQLLKSDIYDLTINNIPSANIYQFNKTLKNDDVIKIIHSSNKKVNIEISYRDSKNNLYKQTLRIIPYYYGGNYRSSTPCSVVLSNRKWSFTKSFKRKYF